MSEPPRAFEVAEEERGRRLDVFLAERLALSRAQARCLLARGAVCIDGRRVAESAKGGALAAGATVSVEPFARPGAQRVSPEPAAHLDVLAAGPGWLAVDKPAGVPVHPLSEEETGSLLGAVAARHPEIEGVGEGGLRSGVVHRLDVDTSGVLLLATQAAAWQRLRDAFSAHTVAKTYRALVCGRVEAAGAADVELVIARHRPARVRVVGADERDRARSARPASMRWRPLEIFDTATLVEVQPRTGFLHQIRAVLAHRGHPLLGDRTYAGVDAASAAPRHMLHASAIRFEEVAAECDDPADFSAALERLRAS